MLSVVVECNCACYRVIGACIVIVIVVVVVCDTLKSGLSDSSCLVTTASVRWLLQIQQQRSETEPRLCSQFLVI